MATKKTTSSTDDTATATDQVDSSTSETTVSASTNESEATTDKLESNTTNKTITAQKDPLLITAKNNGVRRVFEPYSRTLIGTGEQVEIHCTSVDAVAQVKNNLAQLNTLGRRIVYS